MNAPPPRGGKPAKSKNRNNNRSGGNKTNANNNSNSNRRHRNRSNRNSKGRRSQNPNRRGPPQSPQVKITLRNIGNVERYGTVEAIANGIIRPLVEQTNDRLLATATSIVGPKMIWLEKESLGKLISNDKLAKQAREEWKNKQSDAGGKGEERENEIMEGAAETKLEMAKQENNNKNVAGDDIVNGMKDLTINKDKKEMIQARTLYVVPPRQTRRRGEKPGNVYLVLTTPPIPAALIEQPIEESPPANTKGENDDKSNNESNSNNNSNGTQTEERKTAELVPPAIPPKVDYSRQIAVRHLALARVLEFMTAIAAEDAKGNQVWAGCQVEESSNGKSWRPPQRKDHREGTVQESPGFKAFMEMTAKEKEELQARPKPAPGGGLSVFSAGLTGSSDSTLENSKPVAALVLHLQNKREQEKSQKKNKRKAKDTKKKTGGSNENNNGKTTTTTTTTTVGAATKKRGRQRKNKRGTTTKKTADPKP